jgi:hypothetical protein
VAFVRYAHHTASGARKITVVALIEKRASPDPRDLVAPRIFGICLGLEWRRVCEKFLHE